jgi:quinol monooxygenase YgiN
MIHVIATIELHPGRREAFLAEFRKLVPLVLAEDGCLSYGPTIDAVTEFAAQPPPRENVVTAVESWQSLDHLRRHLSAPHMQDYRPRVKDLVVKTTLAILEPA